MEDATRTLFHDALAKSPNAATRALADIVVATPEGRVACWGDLVDYVRAHFQTDEDSVALWQVLADLGDRRPQLLFLDVHRARPGVLRALLDEPARVPPIVQCALVSMPEAEPLLAKLPEGLAPAAREIALSTPQTRVRERAVYEAHMGSLRVQRAAGPFSADAVVRHITEAAQLLRAVDGAPIAEVPTVRPSPEVNQPAALVTNVVPVATVAPIAVPAVAELHPAPRPITEVAEALRPGGPS